MVPPQQRIDEHWYQGTADAVYQNIYTIEKERPKYVVILAGDHIYKMNYAKLVERHVESGADLTVGTLPVGVHAAAGQFGVVEVDADSRVRRVSRRSRRIRSRFPAIRIARWPRWASTCRLPGSSSSSFVSTPPGTAATTTSAAT